MPLRALVPNLQLSILSRQHKLPPSKSKPLVSLLSSPMQSQPLTLLLAGKSMAEIQFATSLISNNSLKLADHSNLHLRLHSKANTSDDNTPSFHVDSYFNSLSTTRFGRFLLCSPRLPSTHDVVSQNFEKLPFGAVCVADVQFKGRGRSKNVWESPPGCLMFSFAVQMENGGIVPLVQYVASLAFTEAINHLCAKMGLPQLEIKIKWPNDLYLNGLKVGGVLCTSSYKSKRFNISVGIGVNVDNRQPTTCLNERLHEITSKDLQLRKEDILGSFFEKFEMLFEVLITQGFQPMEELYYKTWLHSGQRVTIQDICDGQTVDNVVTIQGLTSTGYLMGFGDDGQLCELHPDGNSTRPFGKEPKSKSVRAWPKADNIVQLWILDTGAEVQHELGLFQRTCPTEAELKI